MLYIRQKYLNYTFKIIISKRFFADNLRKGFFYPVLFHHWSSAVYKNDKKNFMLI